MATVQVRYIVHDVEAAIAFYTDLLGFRLVMHPAPAFAMLSLGDLRLVLSAPNAASGGGQAMPDGTIPEPGGWNRFAIEVSDLSGVVDRLRRQGARFRNETVGQPRRAVSTKTSRGAPGIGPLIFPGARVQQLPARASIYKARQWSPAIRARR
jgi:catechol 2,3-dioxygenase-like lactoylglutathione lyase family enzyme